MDSSNSTVKNILHFREKDGFSLSYFEFERSSRDLHWSTCVITAEKVLTLDLANGDKDDIGQT